MPWSQLHPWTRKRNSLPTIFAVDLSVTELCDDYGISRKTGYKWIERY